jgi:uncharacterized membrane protein YccC
MRDAIRSNVRIYEHTVRTTVAGVAALIIARSIAGHQAYWAAITTLIVVQSDLGATMPVAAHRIVGTAIGAVTAAVVSTLLRPTVPAFAIGLFAVGVTCELIARFKPSVSQYIDRSAYRFGGITLAVVMLMPRRESVWLIAWNRFIEISIGIGVALAVAKIWPEMTEPAQ